MRFGYPTLRTGLVACWCPSISGPTANYLLDLSGNGRRMVFPSGAGQTFPADKYGTCLSATALGTEYCLSVYPINEIKQGEATFSFWYKPNSVTTSATIFNQWGGAQGWYIYRNASGQIDFEMPNSLYRVVTTTILTANVWHHIVCRKKSETNGLRVWINGVQDASVGTPGPESQQDSGLTLAGIFYSYGTGPGDAKLDDFRIYNRALTEPEIKLLALKPGIGLLPKVEVVYRNFSVAITNPDTSDILDLTRVSNRRYGLTKKQEEEIALQLLTNRNKNKPTKKQAKQVDWKKLLENLLAPVQSIEELNSISITTNGLESSQTIDALMTEFEQQKKVKLEELLKLQEVFKATMAMQIASSTELEKMKQAQLDADLQAKQFEQKQLNRRKRLKALMWLVKLDL